MASEPPKAMKEYHDRADKCKPTDDVDELLTTNTIVADGGNAADLTAFRKAALAAIAGLNASDDVSYGLAIKRELERYYGQEVNHGRLYPNLDGLEDDGLISTSQVDKRTKRYELTEEGRRVLEADLAWHARRIGMQLVDDGARLQEQPQEADD